MIQNEVKYSSISVAIQDNVYVKTSSLTIPSSQEADQQRRYWSLHGLYDETDPMLFGMNVCLFSQEEPSTYIEA